MKDFLDEALLLTRPQLIQRGIPKKLLDEATHSEVLPVIRVGKEGSRRPRHLYRRVDVESWLEGLAKQEVE